MKRGTRKSVSDPPEPTRRKFSGDWDRALYFYYKILYWFYSRRNRSKAAKFCRSLEPVLMRVANKHESIKGEECWSLLYEIRGNLEKAISYRRSEIRLWKKLLRITARPTDVGPVDLADRLI